MCFGDDARPPLPPVRGGAVAGDDMVLTSADGTELLAFHAHPRGPSATGVVVLPDIRGLFGFYKELAQRFAEAGVHAVAIDYFGRTAGLTPRDADFAFRDHVAQMEPANVAADVGAALAWLRALPGATITSTYTIGFCLGGALSWRQSAAGHGLAGCIGFYGRPDRAADVVAGMAAPLLLLAAGRDHTPVADVEAFAAGVRATAGVEADVHVYPEAEHSFFDRKFAEFGDECDDAWHRMLDFMARHGAAGA